MIRYLIKNNFKIMFRSPVNILLYVLCPILISAILISAFSSLMESYEAPGEFEVGYTVEEDSPYAGIVSALAPVGKENGIIFNRYDGGRRRNSCSPVNWVGLSHLQKKATPSMSQRTGR